MKNIEKKERRLYVNDLTFKFRPGDIVTHRYFPEVELLVKDFFAVIVEEVDNNAPAGAPLPLKTQLLPAYTLRHKGSLADFVLKTWNGSELTRFGEDMLLNPDESNEDKYHRKGLDRKTRH